MHPETARRRRLPVVALVLLAVSLVACLFFGVAWALAANDSLLDRANARDAALRDGQAAVINFNTLDYRDVNRGLQRWEDNSTGPLRDEVRQGRQNYATQIAQAKSTTTARILDAGIVELDEHAGKARMIAVVQVTVTIDGQQPANKQDRYQAELTREGDKWKLSALGTVPVG
ncbi:nuclear transport factor 2 family protein [Saccharopolyspora sp. K220]|uniref:nuclear transport factor 2 family protein n=1 Tax=Saccharopolyspora soli TaxID=2926618 RepID=UPI001F595B2B|nr:nuclear transport factor 2 family protein [Saccharopolyspora soli]MCI2417098.1 nuclear transport factor 2 family protein [Saccharopolyspora soli]